MINHLFLGGYTVYLMFKQTPMVSPKGQDWRWMSSVRPRCVDLPMQGSEPLELALMKAMFIKNHLKSPQIIRLVAKIHQNSPSSTLSPRSFQNHPRIPLNPKEFLSIFSSPFASEPGPGCPPPRHRPSCRSGPQCICWPKSSPRQNRSSRDFRKNSGDFAGQTSGDIWGTFWAWKNHLQCETAWGHGNIGNWRRVVEKSCSSQDLSLWEVLFSNGQAKSRPKTVLAIGQMEVKKLRWRSRDTILVLKKHISAWNHHTQCC